MRPRADATATEKGAEHKRKETEHMRDIIQNERKHGKYCRYDYTNKRIRSRLKRQLRRARMEYETGRD